MHTGRLPARAAEGPLAGRRLRAAATVAAASAAAAAARALLPSSCSRAGCAAARPRYTRCRTRAGGQCLRGMLLPLLLVRSCRMCWGLCMARRQQGC